MELDPFIKNETIQSEYLNPFYLPYNGSDIQFTKNKILKENYDHFFILCKNNDENLNVFYKPNTPIEELIKLKDNVKVIKASIELINSNIIRIGLIKVSNKVLENFTTIELNETELVFLMLEINEEDIKILLSFYERKNNYEELIKYKLISKYYNIDSNQNIINLIEKLDQIKYWENERNCNINHNNEFINRKFNLKSNSLNLNETLKNLTISENYIIDEIFYYDIAKKEKLILNKELIYGLLFNETFNDKEKYYLICNLMINKDHCHFLLNESIFNKFNYEVFKYLLGYMWITLYLEERIKKTNVDISDRYIIDINTASSLPGYIYNPKKYNPYFTCLLSENNKNIENNILGVVHNEKNKIVNLNLFRRRLNTFMSGNPDVNILEGLEWKNMAITGGCMAAIIPEEHPLMLLFNSNNDYFDEYYGNSDIDIICNHDNLIDFIENVKNIKNVLDKNLKQEVKIIPLKTLAMYINKEILKEKCKKGEIPFTFDYIIDNKNEGNVKLYFLELYIEKKKEINEINKKIIKDKYYEILNYCDLDKLTLIFNDNLKEQEQKDIVMTFFLKDNDNLFIRMTENLKYKISSPKLKHEFEIFKVKGNIISSISRFHLPCVRSYYDGNNCYMFPSAVTAYMTFMNIDFKYFVGKYNPIEIIHKYRRRGYGTILNRSEIEHYELYMNKIGDISLVPDKVTGEISVNNDFFKSKGSYNKVNERENVSNLDIYKPIINKDGKIEPVKRWVIDYYWDKN